MINIYTGLTNLWVTIGSGCGCGGAWSPEKWESHTLLVFIQPQKCLGFQGEGVLSCL